MENEVPWDIGYEPEDVYCNMAYVEQNGPKPTEPAQIDGFVGIELGIPTEGVIFQYEPPVPKMKPNQIRHTKNLAIFTGFYHGSYYYRGLIQKPK